eukprot:m.210215 g.210215  ORF g.210215 m.210215 type:complete len:71 (-) comp15049_c2_seq1:3218-3430(-)
MHFVAVGQNISTRAILPCTQKPTAPSSWHRCWLLVVHPVFVRVAWDKQAVKQEWQLGRASSYGNKVSVTT